MECKYASDAFYIQGRRLTAAGIIHVGVHNDEAREHKEEINPKKTSTNDGFNKGRGPFNESGGSKT
jgi:hypothetical protein